MPMVIDMPFSGLWDGSERIYWLYLLVSAVIALLLTLIPALSPSTSRLTAKRTSTASLRAYWLSRDSRLDAAYFLVNWLVRTLFIVPFVLSVSAVALWTVDLLGAVFAPPFLTTPYATVVLCYTLSLFLVHDISRYALHRLMHSSRWLWPFHRIHHAAEVLTPLLVYRVHPLETLMFAVRHALVAGLVTGVFLFIFGARLDVFTILGDNLFIVLLFAFTANLRHSHIRLSYGRWLEHVLISPAQHQIHHEVGRRCNYGSCLALWDWMFGTLQVSADTTGQARFGLARYGERYRSIPALLLEPLRDTLQSIRRLSWKPALPAGAPKAAPETTPETTPRIRTAKSGQQDDWQEGRHRHDERTSGKLLDEY